MRTVLFALGCCGFVSWGQAMGIAAGGLRPAYCDLLVILLFRRTMSDDMFTFLLDIFEDAMHPRKNDHMHYVGGHLLVAVPAPQHEGDQQAVEVQGLPEFVHVDDVGDA